MPAQKKNRKVSWSISFSIAYAHVCEWAKNPELYPRPKPDVLEDAEIHAERIKDQYALDKIQEIRKYYEDVEETVTPDRPGATKQAESIAAKTYSAPSSKKLSSLWDELSTAHRDDFSGSCYIIIPDKK